MGRAPGNGSNVSLREDAMRSMTGRLAAVALVGSFVLTWRAHTDRDIVVAQARKPIVVTRIYTGPDGVSHAEEIEMKLNGRTSEMINATGVEFSSRPPGPASDWHTGPKRQYVITLSGRGEIEVGDGKKIGIGPGHINLIEDTTGKGHTTRNLGPEDRVVVTIPLADQRVAGAGR
jgi:quercetin dioxygenase-like cupin family protein